jgi:uncharacterized membrane protein YphA (DoxX/SURF4 family)
MLVIRVFLAVVFVVYGGIKLLGGQYYYGDWEGTKATIGGTSMVWNFYGYSQLYGRFTGLFEFIPAILLLFPRTATAAAAALFAVTLNVTVMDFAFGFPSVKYASAFYTFLCVVLLIYDSKKKLLLLGTRGETDAAYAAAGEYRAVPRERPKRWSTGRIATAAVVAVFALLFIANMMIVSFDRGPIAEAIGMLQARGFKSDDMKLVRTRMTGQLGERTAKVDIQILHTDPPRVFRVEGTRQNGFVGWRLNGIRELPADTAAFEAAQK